MSVIEKLLHRGPHTAAPPVPDQPAPDTRTLHASTASQAQDGLDEFTEMSVEHPTAAPPTWAPECGTPCYSTRHHHSVIGGR